MALLSFFKNLKKGLQDFENFDCMLPVMTGSTFQLSYAEFTGLIVGAAQNMPMQLHAVTSGLACLGPGTYQFQTHDPNGFYTNEVKITSGEERETERERD